MNTPLPPVRVALVGNPNCGKSTIFNALTGLRQKIANYPGVTVEKKMGMCTGAFGRTAEIIDLPGIYSLMAQSPDEAVTRDVLLGRMEGTTRPDVIVSVLDASSLEKNFYLLSQVLELGIPVICVLNMMDAAEKKGIQINTEMLSGRLGVSVVPTIATEEQGLVRLREAFCSPLAMPKPASLTIPQEIVHFAQELGAKMENQHLVPAGLGYSEALLELGAESLSTKKHIHCSLLGEDLLAEMHQFIQKTPFIASILVRSRSVWAKKLMESCVFRLAGASQASISRKIDTVLLHPVWGWGVFVAIMGALFWAVFSLASIPASWIESLFSWIGSLVEQSLPAGDFRDFLVQGVISGMGGVLIFLPQIVLLFVFLGLLEDTGYIARSVFLVDRVMAKVGLPGRSFIPLLSSFACAIPGILATRAMQNKRDRLLTILVAPFISCSARLPVYVLLISLFGAITGMPTITQGLLMTFVYFLGFLGALLWAWVLKKTILRGEPSDLILELPAYRKPTLRSMLLRAVERSTLFIKNAAGPILMVSICIWLGITYPHHPNPQATPAQAQEYSILGRLGKTIEPAISPLGYDWKIGIAILSSFAAREVFVSTMKMAYNLNEDSEDLPLITTLQKETHPDGTKTYTPATVLSLLVFYVFALQCFTTVVVVWKESGGWYWAIGQLVVMSWFAYFSAFVAYRITLLFFV